MQSGVSAATMFGTYPVLRRLVRIVSTRIGSLGEALLNRLGPITVVGGVVGDLDEDESGRQLCSTLEQH